MRLIIFDASLLSLKKLLAHLAIDNKKTAPSNMSSSLPQGWIISAHDLQSCQKCEPYSSVAVPCNNCVVSLHTCRRMTFDEAAKM